LKKLLLIVLTLINIALADYPDQHKVTRTGELWERMSSNVNIVLSDDGTSLQLADGVTTGYFTCQPDTLPQPFDRGLPSWNGLVEHENAGFRVSMRFRYGTGWSPWLTVGYWKNYVWPSYGSTSYADGYIDYDYVVLEDFHTIWQWRVEMKRQATGHPSPTIDKLSFYTSDERTTDNMNLTSIVNDDPPEIFCETSFVCQYNVDPEIGGSICSPTSTVLALRSLDQEVDPYLFALDNYDDYWNLFGIWPRAVQNAASYPVDGAVTRYRTWSQAYETLAAGGRVVMSVGPPLYSGHLMMLAGFDAQGDPIVHDPARQNGYAYAYNKTSLSRSWFEKGGVSYTFFPEDTVTLAVDEAMSGPQHFSLYQNYPNPFNPETTIRFHLDQPGQVQIHILDIRGRFVEEVSQQHYAAGDHALSWQAQDLDAGVYLISVSSGLEQQIIKATLVK
jgi:hypothetical protein